MSKRIIITHQYPFSAPGGGTRSCLQIAEHLEKMGVEVILVSVCAKHNQETSKQFNHPSIPIISVATHPLHYLLSSLEVANTVKQIIQEKQVDAVLSWEYEGAFLPKLLKSNKVTFGMIAAQPSYEAWVNRKTGGIIKYFTDEWFRWRLFKSADVIFVSSNFTQDELINLFKLKSEKIKITHRGIDALFSEVKRPNFEQISNFIFYGSFAPNKGVFDAIAALGQVAEQGYKNWTIKLAGWGNEEALKRVIKEQRIENQVVFLGRLTPKELVKELEWAHLAILPSQVESFGRAIAEAQAAGLAVISYDTGSVPEIVENGVTGWLVPPKQPNLLANAIIDAIQNPAKVYQMGIEGRESTIKKFTWEKTATAILQGIKAAKQKIVDV